MSIAFPGYVSDVHSADALDPAWGNAIRDRALQIFDTATNRDAAITVPQVGQVGVLTTLSTAGLYAYAGATAGWRAPWNLPWGKIGGVSNASLSQGLTAAADLTSLSVTFTAVANRIYRLVGFVPLLQQATNAAAIKVAIADTSNNVQILIANQNLTASSSGSRAQAYGEVEITGLAAGAKTYKLRATAATTTCTATATAVGTDPGPAFLNIYDAGPNGAPA